MKKLTGYVINLEKSTDRLHIFYQIPNAKETFIRLDAIYGENLSWELIDKVFDRSKSDAYESRPLTKNEIACSLSHLKAYEMIVNNPNIAEDEFAVVAEDDISLIENWYEIMQETIICVQHLKTIKIISMQSSIISDITYNLVKKQFLQLQTNKDAIYQLPIKDKQISLIAVDNNASTRGAACYLIRKSMARKILLKVDHLRAYWLADHWERFTESKDTYFMYPSIAYAKAEIPSVLDTKRKEHEYIPHVYTPESLVDIQIRRHTLARKARELFTPEDGFKQTQTFLIQDGDYVNRFDNKLSKRSTDMKHIIQNIFMKYGFPEDLKFNFYAEEPTQELIDFESNLPGIRRLVNIFVDAKQHPNTIENPDLFDLIISSTPDVKDEIKNHPSFIYVPTIVFFLTDILKATEETMEYYEYLAKTNMGDIKKSYADKFNIKAEENKITLYYFKNSQEFYNLYMEFISNKSNKDKVKFNKIVQPYHSDFLTQSYLNWKTELSIFRDLAEAELLITLNDKENPHNITYIMALTIHAGLVPVLFNHVPAMTNIFNQEAIINAKTLEEIDRQLGSLLENKDKLKALQAKSYLLPEAPKLLIEYVINFKEKLAQLAKL